MNCKKTRSYFYDYADAAVSQRVRSDLENHLSGCAACRQYWEAQFRLHQSVKNAAAAELGRLHFQPKPILAKALETERRPSISLLVGRTAYAMPALLLLCIALWPLLMPEPKPLDDRNQSAFAEAYRYLEMYNAEKPGASSFAMPMAVVIQPDSPARVIQLDGKTDIGAALK